MKNQLFLLRKQGNSRSVSFKFMWGKRSTHTGNYQEYTPKKHNKRVVNVANMIFGSYGKVVERLRDVSPDDRVNGTQSQDEKNLKMEFKLKRRFLFREKNISYNKIKNNPKIISI